MSNPIPSAIPSLPLTFEGTLSNISDMVHNACSAPSCLPSSPDCHLLSDRCSPARCGPYSSIYKTNSLAAPAGSLDSQPEMSQVAVKVIRIPGRDVKYSSMVVDQIMQSMWPTLRHQNISTVKFINASSAGVLLPAIAMPWLKHGNIYEFLTKYPTVDRIPLVKQVSAGLCHIHDHGLVHGNLVPANILVADDGQAVITDVGFHALIHEAKYGTCVPIPHHWAFKSSQELFPTDGALTHTREMDIYAFASTVYTMYTLTHPLPCGRNPFASAYRGTQKIRELGHGRILEHSKPSDMCDGLWRVLLRCWEQDPDQRPSIHEIVDAVEKM